MTDATDTPPADPGSAGPVVVVSGGGTGIGAAVATLYTRRGARVVIAGRRSEPLAAVSALTGAHGVVADVSTAAGASQAIAAAVDVYGRVDVVVANAGGHGYSSVLETTDDDWDASLRANVTSAFALARAGLPELVRSRGSVVVVSSLAGLFAGPDVAGYTVGKHALIGLTRSMARDFGRSGVRANAVCPGWVRTPMADQEMDELAQRQDVGGREEAYGLVTANVPLGRPARPEEIASIICFLGSSESSYVTGAVLVADGGAHVVDVPTLSFS
ncbi:SDR family NAD(P)-dependent oxidoreductase [Aeromicrobium sp. 9AM]|uniref:SDR family NAD(P)-dependent oxidoreductase n=1 Tax=Aeromicrobium sp. 9AM TaxID=2653126 RepID=UPI00135B410C|nr:SDR family oxidoreductase [Aeromicrobium sp. 9AM]